MTQPQQGRRSREVPRQHSKSGHHHGPGGSPGLLDCHGPMVWARFLEIDMVSCLVAKIPAAHSQVFGGNRSHGHLDRPHGYLTARVHDISLGRCPGQTSPWRCMSSRPSTSVHSSLCWSLRSASVPYV